MQQGYLVLADISGYTSFLAKTELDHAHEILTVRFKLHAPFLPAVARRFMAKKMVGDWEGDCKKLAVYMQEHITLPALEDQIEQA